MNLIELINDPTKGEIFRIGFLGQTGYALKKNNTTILIDPYLSNYIEHYNGLNDQKMIRQYPPIIKPHEIDSIDAVLCTHSHFDHMDPWTLKILIHHLSYMLLNMHLIIIL